MINSCPDNASKNGSRSRPDKGSINTSPAIELTWIRQTFSGYACRLSASVSTATHVACRRLSRNDSSFSTVLITREIYLDMQKEAIPKKHAGAGTFLAKLNLIVHSTFDNEFG